MSETWSWNNLFIDIPTLPICCVVSNSPDFYIFSRFIVKFWKEEKKLMICLYFFFFFFFCDLRVKGYILLFVLVQCLTDQLRNDVKMKQKVLERTWICKFLGENAPQTPSPTSLKAHAFGTRISFFKAKWVSALYPFKRGWNVYINGISKMLKKRSY